jgi:AcrR family transcriptional regulator
VERTRRRGQILDAAKQAFALRGYHETSVSDIIEAAGIARGTFYLYFESKRAIFQELIDLFMAAILNCVQKIRLGADRPPPYDQLRANFSRVLALFLEEREITVILLNHAVGLDRESDEKLQDFWGRLALFLERALEAGRPIGLVSIEDTALAARQLLGGVKEVVHYLVVQEAEPREHEHLVDGIVRMILRGALEGPLERILEPVERATQAESAPRSPAEA